MNDIKMLERAIKVAEPRPARPARSEIDFEPFRDNVVLSPDIIPEESKTRAGLITLKSTNAQVTSGTIVALGPDVPEDLLKLGDRVIFSPFSGFALYIRKKPYALLTLHELLGKRLTEDEITVDN